jgi:hypothetical protein
MVPTLNPRTSSTESFYVTNLFTLVRLRLDPKLASFVPTFEGLLDEGWKAIKEERMLLDERMAAEAAVDQADTDLDATSDGVAGVILIETKKNRRSPIFVRYFENQQPSRFRRPILGGQLASMRTWPPSLIASPNAALSAYGQALVEQIKAADAAIALVTAAEQKLADFQTIGLKKQLFDKANGLRKQLHGEASKRMHDHPEWNLPADYADALFQHRSATPEPTIADLDHKIEAANAEVARLTALRDQRIKEEEAEAKAREEADKKALEAALAAAEKAAAEASARVAEIKAGLLSDTP